MLKTYLAGRLGRDAEFKQTQGGHDICSFSVACDVGFGDRKETYWVDVTKWGKGAQGLSGILRKGSAVAVAGELTTREHNGKTYLQCRADDVTILGGTERGERKQSYSDGPNNSFATDSADDVPGWN